MKICNHDLHDRFCSEDQGVITVSNREASHKRFKSMLKMRERCIGNFCGDGSNVPRDFRVKFSKAKARVYDY